MKKSLLVAFVLAFLFAGGGHAKRGKAGYVGAGDNPFFVTDEKDKRVLYPSERAIHGGLDGDYIATMARPRVPQALIDEIRAQIGNRAVKLRASDGMPNPALAIAAQGDILVIEGNSTFVVQTQNGIGFNHNNGLFTAASEMIGRFGDVFDFITVFTTFEDPNVAAYYVPLRQDVEGLGDCNLNSGESLGCIFDQTGGLRLQGIVFMNSIGTWKQWDSFYDGVTHPIDSFNSSVYSTLGQEIAHRWGSGLRFVDPRNGSISKKLLGRDNSHWAAWVDTDASVMDGWDWEPDGDAFDLVNDMNIYSTLDLYAMGALPVAAAEPFFFIDNARFTERTEGPFAFGIHGDPIPADAALQLPGVFFQEQNGIILGATGERVDLTIQDIVDAEGNRCPDPDHTQRAFRQGVVLVTRPGQTIAAAQPFIDELMIVNATWEQWWADRTARAFTICTSTIEDCVQAVSTLTGGDFVSESGDFIERGSTPSLVVTAGAEGTTVKNAVLTLTLSGDGAEAAGLKEGEFPLGDIAPGSTVDTEVRLRIDEDFPCGESILVQAALSSDNAATVRENFRVFPGMRSLFTETFGKNDDFTVDSNAQSGAFVKHEVALSCDMTRRTPERDFTPSNAGAYVTGVDEELDGSTTLISPEIDLRGTARPFVFYDYWFDAEGSASFVVEISADGDEFTRVSEETVSFHAWDLGVIDVKSVLGTVPEKLFIRFTANGDGRTEAGVDNVRVFEPEGQCGAELAGSCACSADGSASPQSLVGALLALLGLRALCRRGAKPS